MKQIVVMEKYPVFTLEMKKTETSYQNIDEILSYLKELIDMHPIAVYIGEFDHYSHTNSLAEGEISAEIKDAKNIICCFGKQLTKAEVLAVRPRSIGVVEMSDSFIMSFLEAPNPQANDTMVRWVKSIQNL